MSDRDAYERGWRAQMRSGDWDEAEARFAAANCSHDVRQFCELEHAWSSGWSDRQAGRTKWHAIACLLGVAADHGSCPL